MPPRPCPQVPVDKPVERVREHVEVREVKVPVDRVIERVVVPRARWKSKVGAGGRGGGGQTGPLSASVEGTKIRVNNSCHALTGGREVRHTNSVLCRPGSSPHMPAIDPPISPAIPGVDPRAEAPREVRRARGGGRDFPYGQAPPFLFGRHEPVAFRSPQPVSRLPAVSNFHRDEGATQGGGTPDPDQPAAAPPPPPLSEGGGPHAGPRQRSRTTALWRRSSPSPRQRLWRSPTTRFPPCYPPTAPPPIGIFFFTQPKTTELHLPLFLSPSFIPRVLAALGKREPSPNVLLPDTSERLSHVGVAAEKYGLGRLTFRVGFRVSGGQAPPKTHRCLVVGHTEVRTENRIPSPTWIRAQIQDKDSSEDFLIFFLPTKMNLRCFFVHPFYYYYFFATWLTGFFLSRFFFFAT